jgi:hypothetical protein
MEKIKKGNAEKVTSRIMVQIKLGAISPSSEGGTPLDLSIAQHPQISPRWQHPSIRCKRFPGSALVTAHLPQWRVSAYR